MAELVRPRFDRLATFTELAWGVFFITAAKHWQTSGLWQRWIAVLLSVAPPLMWLAEVT
jgi:hypothetical protein